MQIRFNWATRLSWILGAALLVMAGLPSGTAAQTLTPLVNFGGTRAAEPRGDLIADAQGDLFGTTEFGGTSSNCSDPRGCGTIFEILCNSHSTPCTSWDNTPTTLYNFCTETDCTDGWAPIGGLIADTQGNLFGTASAGGTSLQGMVFMLHCQAFSTVCGAYAGAPTPLVNFDRTDGEGPRGRLIADAQGNLFGTTRDGGTSSYCPFLIGCGTVFEILCNSHSTPCTSWDNTPTTLYNFCTETDCTDGTAPQAGLIADAQGNLFGTTTVGGTSSNCPFGCGTAFEIACNSASTPCTSWDNTPPTLYNFCAETDCTDGSTPIGGLIADAQGNLFGTAKFGGANGGGTLFELPKSAGTSTGYTRIPTTLYNFCTETDCTDGAGPQAGLIADAQGDLFGTAESFGANGDGTVFSLACATFSRVCVSYATTLRVLYSFDGADGRGPSAGLIADTQGNLFGTTEFGGTSSDCTDSGGCGTVFAVPASTSGFLPPTLFAGTPGTSNCASLINTTLARTYGGLSHAAAGLGYASVADLRNHIATYCSG